MKMSNELDTIPNKQIDISEVNGRTTIVYKKALLKGKVSSNEVLNALLLAARMQAEYYISKLSRGSPLDSGEIKAMSELANITKLSQEVEKTPKVEEIVQITDIKSALYAQLSEKLSKKE